MTTIACDGLSMAGDGRITEHEHICCENYEKVRRLSDGRIIGFCGNAYNNDAFAAWIEAGAEGDPPKMHDQFGCVVLTPAGQVYTYDEHGRRFEERPPYAAGTGACFALAAMDLGFSAEEAVIAAAKRDIYTGGVVISFYRIPSELKAVA